MASRFIFCVVLDIFFFSPMHDYRQSHFCPTTRSLAVKRVVRRSRLLITPLILFGTVVNGIDPVIANSPRSMMIQVDSSIQGSFVPVHPAAQRAPVESNQATFNLRVEKEEQVNPDPVSHVIPKRMRSPQTEHDSSSKL